MNTIAERIQNSRKTLKQISDEAQISLERLREIATSGEASLSELRRLAGALDLELSDFLSADEPVSKTVLLFRQTMGDRLKRSYLPDIAHLSHRIDQTIQLLPTYRPPQWLSAFDYVKHDFLNAQKLAEKFRTVFLDDDQVSPLYDLPRLTIEKLDILLMVIPKLKIDGASAIVNGVSFIFVSPRFRPRMLFTLAHELGHMIAHHKYSNSYALLDAESSVGRFDPKRGIQEAFVDAFASCLLLPAAGVGVALQKIRALFNLSGDSISELELLYLSHIFGVSFIVAAKRCEDIGLIERGSAFSLYEKLCREYKSPEKRAMELNLPPRAEVKFPVIPSRLLQSAAEKIRLGEMSIGKVAQTLKLTMPNLVEELATLNN